jgi:UDP-perosamine 4-acetyltransferase
MKAPVLILGTAGFAIELSAIVRASGGRVVGFVGPDRADSLPAPYLGNDDVLGQIDPEARVLVAVGEPSARKRLFDFVTQSGRVLETLVSPLAFVADDARIGEGCIVYPHATVHSRVCLGRGVLVNSNASIGHETQIGDFANVGPGVSLGGRCKIGEETYLGIGSTMLEELTVADGTVVGAGAVVTKDIVVAGTYVGVPANRRPL